MDSFAMEDWIGAMAAEQAASCARGTSEYCADIVPSRYAWPFPLESAGMCRDPDAHMEAFPVGISRANGFVALDVAGHRFVWMPRRVPAKADIPQHVAAGIRPDLPRADRRRNRREGASQVRRLGADPDAWDAAAPPHRTRLRSPAAEI